MVRLLQATLILSTVLASWLGMQQVHELGHIAAARLVGGSIDHIALHPLMISHTDVGPNGHPLVVVWAGPLNGVLAPLILWAFAAALRLRESFLLRFFAGFCLVANGVYIGVGSFFGIGDAGEMLRHGSPIWTLWLFGATATLLGFVLWNGQGRHFGLGPSAETIHPRSVLVSAAALGGLMAIGLSVGGG